MFFNLEFIIEKIKKRLTTKSQSSRREGLIMVVILNEKYYENNFSWLK